MQDLDTTFKVKGQCHQAALLSSVLTREAGAAVTVRTYWSWETTATLRLLGGARGAGAPTGRRGAGHILSIGEGFFIISFVRFMVLCSLRVAKVSRRENSSAPSAEYMESAR